MGWHAEQETPLHRMVTDVTCEKKDMLLIGYEAPDGARRHNRLWNGGAGVGTVQLYERHVGGERLIDEVRAENIGCEYGAYCESSFRISDRSTSLSPHDCFHRLSLGKLVHQFIKIPNLLHQRVFDGLHLHAADRTEPLILFRAGFSAGALRKKSP